MLTVCAASESKVDSYVNSPDSSTVGTSPAANKHLCQLGSLQCIYFSKKAKAPNNYFKLLAGMYVKPSKLRFSSFESAEVSTKES